MKGNLSPITEMIMIFNFSSIAIQKPKSGLSARLENSFQGFCECHKSVSWGQKSTSWPKFQLKCVKREKTCQKLQKKCLEAGKFHCNFVRENNAQVSVACRCQPYLYWIGLCKPFLSQQAREERRNGPHFAYRLCDVLVVAVCVVFVDLLCYCKQQNQSTVIQNGELKCIALPNKC